MPEYTVKGPDGTSYRVTAPEGATQEQIISYAQQQTEPGFLRRNVIDPVVSAFRGPKGLPDLPEFDEGAPGGTLDTIKTAGGLMLATEPEGQANIIRQYYPNARVEPITAPTGETYHTVTTTDPETGEERQGYVNAPGFSFRDATQLAGQAALFAPAGRAAQGVGTLARMAGVAGKSAATSVGIDLGAEALGADQSGIMGVSPARAVVSAAAGGLFEGLSPLAAKAWRRLLGRKQYFDASTGRLTEAGRQRAIQLDLDPDGMEPALNRTFSRYAREGAEPGIVRRTVDADEFGIRQSRAQQTDDYGLANMQERMAKGLEGVEPQRIVKEFLQGQQDDIARAQAGVGTRLSGRTVDDVTQPADIVRADLGAREQAVRQQVDNAYEAARAAGPLEVPREATSNLAERMRGALQDRAVDRGLTPATVSALRDINKRLGRGGNVLKEFENTRRVVEGWRRAASNSTDRANVGILKGELDNWLDDTIDAGLYAGDPEVVALLKDARGLRRQYGQLFERSGSRDRAGAMVEKIMGAETPEQAANYILGAGEIGRNPELTVALRRLGDAMGRDSEGWGAIREMVWDRLSRSPQGQPLTSRVFQNKLNTALARNQSALREVFSPDEIKMLQRYGRALEAAKTESTNPSQTAFALENAIRYTLRRFAQRETFTKGNVGTGTVLNFMARMPLNPLGATEFSKRMAAGRLLERMPPPTPLAPGFVGTGTAATVQSADDMGPIDYRRPMGAQ